MRGLAARIWGRGWGRRGGEGTGYCQGTERAAGRLYRCGPVCPRGAATRERVMARKNMGMNELNRGRWLAAVVLAGAAPVWACPPDDVKSEGKQPAKAAIPV